MSHPDQVAAHIQDTGEPVQRHRRAHPARRLVRQAERLRRRSSGVVQARSVRRLHQEDRRPGRGLRPTRKDTAIFITFDEGGGYYDSGLRAAARLLRRRHPHPADRGFAVREAAATSRTNTPTTSRSSSSSSATGVCSRSPLAAATTSRTRSRAPRIPTCRSTARPSATCSTSLTSTPITITEAETEAMVVTVTAAVTVAVGTTDDCV